MPRGKIKAWKEDKFFGFIAPDGGGPDVFFHESALREGDEVTIGAAVEYTIGTDKKTGKTKAETVDLI